MYTEVNVNINGIAESPMEFLDNPKGQKEMENFIEATQRFAYDNSDFDVEIYKLYHPHVQGIECECIQYLSDHNPYWRNKE